MKLLFVTQEVDPEHPVLGATSAKIAALAARVDELVVLANAVATESLPPNCRARSFRSRFRVGRGARFDREQEQAYDRARPARSHFVRDAQYLNWRYAESPRGYRCLGAFRDGRLRGFAVVGHKLHGGISAAYVADLVAPRTSDARALLRHCLAEARGGADAVIALPRPPLAAFAATGFVPTPQTIRLIGKPLAAEARLPADGCDWQFSLGDSDIF